MLELGKSTFNLFSPLLQSFYTTPFTGLRVYALKNEEKTVVFLLFTETLGSR